MIIGMLVIDSC